MSGSRAEDGFTVIEVIVAAFLAVIVIGAGAVVFSQGAASSLAAQRQGELIAVADQQLENIRQQLKTTSGGFGSLALSAAPAAGTSGTIPNSPTAHTDPNYFVSASGGCGTSNQGYTIEANWDNTSEGTASGVASWSGCSTGVEPLLIQAGGLVSPGPTSVTIGSGATAATATVYTYVTDTYIGCSSSLGSCASATNDAKRVIIAVKLTPPGSGSNIRYDVGQVSPVYVSTIFTNPVPTNQVNNSIGLTLGNTIG